MREALEQAIKMIGNKNRVAQLCGISPVQIAKWLKAGKTPPHRCIELERATNGGITRYELRPDIYPPEDYDLRKIRRERWPKEMPIDKT